MSEEPQVPPESSSKSGESWQEVGQQFQALGASLSKALRTAWENEQTQERVQEMRGGIEAMARDIGKAVEDTANSPQGQQVRQDASRAVETLRSAGEQTVQEVRPQIINALQQLNEELQKLINRMEQPPSAPPPPPSTDPTGTGPDQPL